MSYLDTLEKEASVTRTLNGARTYSTSSDACLDLFAVAGGMRGKSEKELFRLFDRAYIENPELAVKLLFYIRDIRGGLGEREVFRTLVRHLAKTRPGSARKNVSLIAEYGRYDDLLCLMRTPAQKEVVRVISSQLEEDLKALEARRRGDSEAHISLLAKWLPSVNTSNKEACRMGKRIAKALGMTDEQYRKTLVKLRAKIKIIENNLREKDYTFDYAAQPAWALLKYRFAFRNHDRERYAAFLSSVERGEVTMHTGTLYPYDIVRKALNFRGTAFDRKALDVTWNAQEDCAPEGNALCVIDGSGSMYSCGNPVPATVALSLEIYFAERNRGEFHNRFITFSRTPQLVTIDGKDIVDKVRYCRLFNEVSTTNIRKVFDLILDTAVKYRIPQSEMPETLYIISDMEFDRCAEDSSLTNFEYAKQQFEAHGYNLPKVVFWNVQSRNMQQPVRMNEQGVALVSGCTPRIFEMVTGGNYNPATVMLRILCSERYAPVCA